MSSIKQRTINTITASTPLSYADMGEIILNSSSTPTITVPNALNVKGLWYRFINLNYPAIITESGGTTITTLAQNLSTLIMSDGTDWIEALGGVISTFNAPLSESDNVISLDINTDTLAISANELKVKDNTFSSYTHNHDSAYELINAVSNHAGIEVDDSGGVHGFEIDTPIDGYYLKYDTLLGKHIHAQLDISELDTHLTALVEDTSGVHGWYVSSTPSSASTDLYLKWSPTLGKHIYDVPTGTGEGGDMYRAVYDSNEDGIVAEADDSYKLGGELPAYYATASDVDLLEEINALRLEPTGITSHTGLLYSFNNSNRTFTIQASTPSTYTYYINGAKYTKSTDSIIIDNSIGTHFIYYNSTGTLQKSMTAWQFESTCMVAMIYWNGTDNRICKEWHGISMDWATHEYLHETIGARYASGLTGTFGNTTFTISAGEYHDEDLTLDVPTTTQTRVFYRNSGNHFTWTALQNEYYYLSGGNVYYDNASTPTPVTSNRYVAYWIFATNDYECPIISIMGQRQDTTLANARLNNTYETLSFGTLPYYEYKLLYRVILKNDATPYEETIDYRTVSPIPTSSYVATNHSTLSGLTNLDHPASAIKFTPAGTLTSENVQDAITELDTQTSKTSYIADWDLTVTYSSGDAVYYSGKFYKSLVGSNLNNTPPVTTDSYWENITVGGGAVVDGIYTSEPLEIETTISATPNDCKLLVTLDATPYSTMLFASTPVLMLHFNEGNWINNFVDSRLYPKFIQSGRGTYSMGKMSSFGTGSMYLDGTGDYITVLDNSAFEFGAGDFTIEMWVCLPTKMTSGSKYLYNKQASNTSGASISVYLYYSGGLNLRTTYSINGTSSTTNTTVMQDLTPMCWHHIVSCRDTVNLRHFIDGVQVGATHNISTSNISNSASNVIIGADGAGANAFTGWIDELRVSKYARYTADGATPTTEFSSDANTSLLLHFNEPHASTPCIDSSSNSFALATTGNTIIWADSYKFGNSSLWLDGATKYVLISDSMDFDVADRNFTIDCWINMKTLPVASAYMTIYGHKNAGGSNETQGCYIYNNTGVYKLCYIYTLNGSTQVVNYYTITPIVGTWYHVAIVRNGTTIRPYWNGTSLGDISISTSSLFNTSYNFTIGASANSSSFQYYFSGWIDSFRFIKNQALWTSSPFTPPTLESEYI